MSNPAVTLSSAILTTGQLFPNGAIIEQLRDHQLMFVHEERQLVGPIISYEDKTYAAATLDDELQKALCLPASATDFTTVNELLCSITDLLASYDVEPTTAWLVANYTLTTWVADCVPGVPILNLWGPTGADSALLEIVRGLCRRPLRMLTPSLRELERLPNDLCPTIMVKNPKSNALVELIAAAGPVAPGLFHAGKLRHFNCAILICSELPVSCVALHVPLLIAARSYRRITSIEAEDIANRYQPRLLAYRLKRHLEVARSQFDCEEFATSTRLLARILGSALAGDLENQARLVDALRRSDEQNRVDLSQTTPASILEALLTACHENKPCAQTGDVAKLATSILLARGERIDLSAKAVGGILRNQFGFESARSGPGYVLRLTTIVQQQIHRLAGGYGVLSLVDPTSECELCHQYCSNSTGENNGDDQTAQST